LEDLNQERLQLLKEHRLEGSQLEDLDSQLDEILKVGDMANVYLCNKYLLSMAYFKGVWPDREDA
jgi:hypothetical protein